MADTGGTGGESLSPEDVGRQRFATSFRGFDQAEVRAFLSRVAEQLAWARTAEAELRAQVVALQSQPPPPVDLATLTSMLGEETSRIVHTAQEAAADLKARAEENVTRILAGAHEEATRVRTEAEEVLGRRTAEAEAAAAAIRQQAEAQAHAIVADATWRAQQLAAEAEATRDDILEDLARKRRVAHQQVEQLQAGRDRLLESYAAVRRSLDDVTGELDRVEDEARAASQAAARRVATAPPLPPPELAQVPPPAPAPAPAPPAPAPAAPPAPPEVEIEIATTEELAPEPIDIQSPPAVVHYDPPDGDDEGVGPVVPIVGEPPKPAAAPHLNLVLGEPPEAMLAVVEAPSEVESVRLIPADAPTPANPSSVQAPESDALFARIRAERAEAAVAADTPPAPEVLEAPEAPPSAGPTDDEVLLQQRDAALDPLHATLARKLKRALQDEQNDVLDRLRMKRKLPEVSDLLGDEPAQRARYHQATAAVLEQAAQAGAETAGGRLRRGGAEGVADELADAVAGPLRRRLEKALGEAGGSDQEIVSDGISAAYREWRSPRIERVVGDHLAAAFALGVFTATAAGTVLRWVVDDADGDCADCDDNALAGGTARGDEYPTGQTHPPAHPGCRCLLVPAT
ncbi:MAG TPA: DivIVA domain-containing protein [Acidimicrobiales bacterium]|nr:DivIVA domain-containing protein [Acidimicrobiales bacterium]